MILRVILAIVFLVVVVGGLVGFNLFRDQAIEGFFAGMQPPPVAVSVVEAEPSTWRPGIDAIGTARAAQGVDLAVEAGGTVKEILFEANGRVSAGQILVRINDTIERADLEAARASLELSQTQLERAETLRERGITAINDLDAARAAATNAQAQVAKLTAIMDEKALEAPFDGVIGIPQIDVGEYVIPGTFYATLQNLDTMRVFFSVPEQQLSLIEIGGRVTVSSEIDETIREGHISAIEPKIDPNTRLATVRAQVENSDAMIRPGQFLRVTVRLPEEDSVIALPQTVLSSNLYGDTVYVVRTEGEGEDAKRTVEQVFVKAGRRAEGLVEIVEGVEPGDEVVSAGQNRLSGGSPVTIDNSVNPVPQPGGAG